MSKTLTNKVRLILVLALVMVVSVCAGMFAFAKAEPTISSVVEADSFTMESAGLIVEGDDGLNGLEFTVSMSAEQYEALQANGGFETGVVIAPAYYEDKYDDINLDTLFGVRSAGDIVYDWAEYDDVTGEYVYNGDKVRVVNINADKWVLKGGKYTYSGAIVDIQDHNETVLMVGAAYLKDDLGDYRMVGDYIYTSVALELESEYDGMTEDQKAWVDANWTRFVPFVAEDMLVDVSLIDNGAVAAYELIDDEIGDWEYRIPGNDGLVITLTDENGNVKPYEPFDAIYFTEENLRLWTLDVSYNGVVVYTGKVDLYDSTSLSFLWNDEISLESVDAITYEGSDKERKDYDLFGKGEATEVEIEGVDYINYSASGSNGTWYAWRPLHSKAYYELFATKGIELTATLTIDVSGMLDPSDENGVINQTSIFGVDGPVTVKQDVVLNGTISLADVLANWDGVVGCNWDGQWGTRKPLGMIYVYNVHNGGKINVTFGTKVDASAFANNGGDILVKLDEVEDLTALDLTSYMDEAHVKALDTLAGMGETLVYEMSGYSIADTIEVADLTAVNVSEIKNAAYVLTVKSGEVIVYTATFDFYNSTDAVVWATELTQKNVIVQYGGYTTGRAAPAGELDYEIVTATAENPVEGKTSGQFIKLVDNKSENVLVSVLPLHTQDYYREVVGQKNFVLYFKLFEGSESYMSGLGINGINNYGMYNPYKDYRAGGNLDGAWENYVMSLDNYLICETANTTYTGAYFDLSQVGKVGSKYGCMMQIEMRDVTEENGFTVYVGDFQIVEGYETLMSTETSVSNTTSVYKTNLSIDLAGETAYDLRGIFNDISKAKYDYYISVVGVDNNGKGGNPPIYWKVTFGDGSTINVVANAQDDPATILDLTKEVAEGVTVADKLNANSTITILAYAPNIAANGLASHPTYLACVKIDFSNVPTLTPAE